MKIAVGSDERTHLTDMLLVLRSLKAIRKETAIVAMIAIFTTLDELQNALIS